MLHKEVSAVLGVSAGNDESASSAAARLLRRSVTSGVVRGSGGCVAEDGELLRMVGSAVEAGAVVVVDAAISAAATGYAAVFACAFASLTSAVTTPLTILSVGTELVQRYCM